MKYFRVKNFEKFQHYKDRNPTWIKLYVSILNDFDFMSLPMEYRWFLVAIWLIATKTDNKIPRDMEWLAHDLRTDPGDFDLDILFERGFLEDWTEDSPSVILEDWPTRHISKTVKDAVSIRDEHQCVYCGSNRNIEFDHIIPVSKGGESVLENIQLLCRSCNRKKRSKLTYAEQDAAELRSLEEKRVEERR